jgi:hypothetical protein
MAVSINVVATIICDRCDYCTDESGHGVKSAKRMRELQADNSYDTFHRVGKEDVCNDCFIGQRNGLNDASLDARGIK